MHYCSSAFPGAAAAAAAAAASETFLPPPPSRSPPSQRKQFTPALASGARPCRIAVLQGLELPSERVRRKRTRLSKQCCLDDVPLLSEQSSLSWWRS